MAEGIFNYERKKIKKLIYLHCGILVLFLLIACVILCSRYFAGYYAFQDNYYGAIFFWALMGSFPLLLIVGFFYIVVPVSLGFRYFMPSLAFLGLSLLLMYGFIRIVPQGFLLKGYYKCANNNADIAGIQEWLIGYKITSDTPIDSNDFIQESIHDFDRPECIKVLNPRYVSLYEKDSKRYVRLFYSLNWEENFGLCISEEGVDVPFYNYKHEQRKSIQDNAFVWLAY